MFKFTSQIISKEVDEIIAREVDRQNFAIRKASKKVLKEIFEISEEIKKHELPKQFVRKTLPNNLGEGLFLRTDAAPIEKGSVIAPYTGEVTIVPQNEPDDADYAFAPLSDMYLNKEEQKQYDRANRFSPARLYAIKLDALKKGNFTRSINHSEDPNVYADTIEIGKNSYNLPERSLEVIYFAKRKINPGEQLLVSYEGEEDSYWEACDYEPFHMSPKTFRVNQDLELVSDL
ncbi:MAG: hypothetical protein S4CHLAM37_11050 [Chlamydiia bacterium]|nr:hypothetical protein [Chlamydiia bacterium]